jgi:hypothetical protein
VKIEVTFAYEAEPDEQDVDDATGLTVEAFDTLHDQLTHLGATDIKVMKVNT